MGTQNREAPTAVWPKKDPTQAAGKTVYYRGHAGCIHEIRVSPDDSVSFRAG